MSEALFNAIVAWLQAICAATGLTYSEINILIYCGFIPAILLIYLWCFLFS